MTKTTAATQEAFRLLRVSINAMLQVAGPSKGARVISVISALPGDGRSFIADGLANAFAESGAKTVLLDEAFSQATDLHIENTDGFFASSGPLTRAFPEASARQAEETHALLKELQTNFDVIVVAAAAVRPSEAALVCFTASSGVLISVALGRKRSHNDAELVDLLGKLGVPVLGAVPSGPEAKAFTPFYVSQNMAPVNAGVMTSH